MNENKKKRILQCIQKRESLEKVLNTGYSYVQLIKELLSLQEDNLIIYDDDKYVLTSDGEAFVNRPLFCAIEPIEKYKCPKISLDEIYIPNYIEEIET